MARAPVVALLLAAALGESAHHRHHALHHGVHESKHHRQVKTMLKQEPKLDKGVSEKSKNRLGAVIETLEDILQSVQEGDRRDAKNYKCYMEWCNTELSETNKSLTEAQDELQFQTVAIEANTAAVTSLSTELGKLEDDRHEVRETMDQAAKIRGGEQKEYDQDSTLNKQSLGQVDRAIQIVSKVNKQGGFLQNGVLQHLHLNQPGESNYVLGIMKGIKSNLLRNKASMDASEATKVKQYNDLTGTKKSEDASMTKTFQGKQITLNEKKVALAEAQNAAEEAKDAVEELSKKQEDVSDGCKKKTGEWNIRSDERQAEKAAIRTALEFVQKSMPAEKEAPEVQGPLIDDALTFAQLDMENEVEAKPVRRAAPAAPSRPLSFLEEEEDDDDEDESRPATGPAASALVQSADAQLSALMVDSHGHLKKEGFAAVIKLVKDTEQALHKEQAEEKEKKKFCLSELARTKAEISAKKEAQDKAKATKEKKEAAIEEAKNVIAGLNEQQKVANKTIATAKDIRRQEMRAYGQGKKDRELAAKVVKQAIQVMDNYYGAPAAVLAQSVKQGPETWESGSGTRSNVAGQQAVLLMQKVAGEIELEQKEAKQEEAEAMRLYRKYMEEQRSARDLRQEELVEQSKMKGKLSARAAALEEELVSIKADLETLNSQLVAIHEDCDQLLANYDKRKEARAFEIQQMRDVVDILSGSSIAPRTGGAALFQGAEDDRELRDLRELSGNLNSLADKARLLAH